MVGRAEKADLRRETNDARRKILRRVRKSENRSKRKMERMNGRTNGRREREVGGRVIMVDRERSTRGSSHHVVYRRYFILIFREGGVGMVEERESMRQRDG